MAAAGGVPPGRLCLNAGPQTYRTVPTKESNTDFSREFKMEPLKRDQSQDFSFRHVPRFKAFGFPNAGVLREKTQSKARG